MAASNPQAWKVSAVDGVVEAVSNGVITNAHAELLCVLRPEVQITALAHLVGSTELPGVAELRTSIEALALPLENVSFPLDDCSGCRFNSTTHTDLGLNARVAVGLCLNGACSSKKAQEHAENVKLTLKNRHRTVKIVPIGFAVDRVKSSQVGDVQEKYCQSSCADFGATVTVNRGAVTSQEGVCMSVECLQTKRTSFEVSTFEAWKQSVWRHALKGHMRQVDARTLMLALISLLTFRATGPDASPMNLDSLSLPVSDPSDLMAHLMGLESQERRRALLDVLDLAIGHLDGVRLQPLIRSLQVDICAFWCMTPKAAMKLPRRFVIDILREIDPKVNPELVNCPEQAWVTLIQKIIVIERLTGYLPSALMC